MFPMKHKSKERNATLDEVRKLRHDVPCVWNDAVDRFISAHKDGDQLLYQQADGCIRYVGRQIGSGFTYVLVVSMMLS